MDKGIKIPFYLTLHEDAVKGTKDMARTELVESWGEGEVEDNLGYFDSTLDVDEMYLDEEGIQLSGEILNHGKNLGYISFAVPLTHNLNVELAEHLISELEKLRDALKALK